MVRARYRDDVVRLGRPQGHQGRLHPLLQVYPTPLPTPWWPIREAAAPTAPRNARGLEVPALTLLLIALAALSDRHSVGVECSYAPLTAVLPPATQPHAEVAAGVPPAGAHDVHGRRRHHVARGQVGRGREPLPRLHAARQARRASPHPHQGAALLLRQLQSPLLASWSTAIRSAAPSSITA